MGKNSIKFSVTFPNQAKFDEFDTLVEQLKGKELEKSKNNFILQAIYAKMNNNGTHTENENKFRILCKALVQSLVEHPDIEVDIESPELNELLTSIMMEVINHA